MLDTADPVRSKGPPPIEFGFRDRLARENETSEMRISRDCFRQGSLHRHGTWAISDGPKDCNDGKLLHAAHGFMTDRLQCACFVSHALELASAVAFCSCMTIPRTLRVGFDASMSAVRKSRSGGKKACVADVVELKLDLTRDAADVLEASALWSGDPKISEQRSIYFDTPDHRLSKAGLSRRIRRSGRKRIQTTCATTAATHRTW